MRTMAIPNLFYVALAGAWLSTGTIEVTAATPPIRIANSRTLVAQAPAPTPLPPAPAPGIDAGLGSPIPSANSATPPAPVPPPEPGPGGAMYSKPFGTMREPLPPPVKQFTGDADGQGSFYTPSDAPTPTTQPMPALDPNAPMSATDRFGFTPPPGTLGHTYHRRSRVLEDKVHPRVGIVEVHLSENYDVSDKGLKSKWTGKHWELVSDPLLPGVPHIFEIKAEWGPEKDRKKEVRTVRLIMGRAVDLEF
jgi:hypothetical protein